MTDLRMIAGSEGGNRLGDLLARLAAGEELGAAERMQLRLLGNALQGLLGFASKVNPVSGSVSELSAGPVVIANDGITLLQGKESSYLEDANIKWRSPSGQIMGDIGGWRNSVQDYNILLVCANADADRTASAALGALALEAFGAGTSKTAVCMLLSALGDGTQALTVKVGPYSGQTTAFSIDSSAAGAATITLASIKATTGDPTPAEGMLTINTFDNVIKMYADGAWRQLAAW